MAIATIDSVSPQPVLKPRRDRLLFGVSVWLLLGATALLVFHKRVGIADEQGVSIVRLLLRPDIWFTSCAATAVISWRLSVWSRPPSYQPARWCLYWTPLLAAFSAIIGSLLAYMKYGVALNPFGSQVILRLVLCWFLGLYTYEAVSACPRLARRMIRILTWSPLVSVLLGAWYKLAPTTLELALGRNWLEEPDGLFAYGARFQGATSNPNMVATTSAIAFALLMPKLFQFRFLHIAYALCLIGVILWSGVRAMALCLPLLFVAYFWLRFRPTKRRLRLLALRAVGMLIIIAVGAAILMKSSFEAVLRERLESGDGRLFLWSHYTRVFLQHPFGLGLGYESIVQTDQVIEGQRLPPHNTLLEMAMYGGVLGLLAHLTLLRGVVGVIFRLRKSLSIGVGFESVHAVTLAWLVIVFSLMFGGLAFMDYQFILLTALFLAFARRLNSQRRQQTAESVNVIN